MGLLDDRYDLPARPRLLVQIIAALGIVVTGVQMHLTGIGLIDVPVTVIWIVAITNATNYLDNMDGQSAGVAAIAAFFFMLIAFTQNLSLVSSLAAAVLGSALGFLVYNFNPSSTFMGDMGALPLGFILAVLAIKLEFDQPFSLRWLISVFVLMLPVMDINLVTWTRLFEGRSPARGGQGPQFAPPAEHRLRPAWRAAAHLRLLSVSTVCWPCWSANRRPTSPCVWKLSA